MVSGPSQEGLLRTDEEKSNNVEQGQSATKAPKLKEKLLQSNNQIIVACLSISFVTFLSLVVVLIIHFLRPAPGKFRLN